MTKQVYELTAEDLDRDPVWVFPMDHTVEDETSVRPTRTGENVPDGLQRIARCTFRDIGGREFPGYVYESDSANVEERRPVAWCDSICITFWNGMIEPAPEYVAALQKADIRWPLLYEVNVDGVAPMNGTLDGIYYLKENDVRCMRVPSARGETFP